MYSGFTSIRRRCCITVLILSGCFWCSITQGAEDTLAVWRVVILHSSDVALPASVLLEQTARKTLLAGTTRRIEFYTESLDGLRLPDSGYESTFVEYLQNKYKDRKPDIIIAVIALALDFVQQHRLALWRVVPVVFCGIPEEVMRGRSLGSGITGVCLDYDIAGTIDLAINLQPNARRLVPVAGVGDYDKFWFQRVEQVCARYPRLQTVGLTNRSMPELMEAVRRLPRDSIVLYVSVYRDTTGQVFVPQDVLKQLSQISGAPIYGGNDTHFGYGIVGGVISSWETQGRHAAQIALRILAGEKPEAIPIEPSPPAKPMVDWRELKRWGISEHLLPLGTIEAFRQPSFWESYRWYIVTALSLCLLEALLIVVLLVQLRRRRLAEAALRESEQHMGLAASAAELAMWKWDILRDQIWMSDKGRALFGIAPDTRLDLAALSARVHPEDRAARDAATRRALETQGEYATEYRVVLSDGQVRWIAGRGRVESGDGKPLRMRGVSRDCTAQKQADQETARQRTELAHRSRVMLLGELSGSLAHELNQPLGAIVTNAGAALRSLGRDRMTREQFREVLEDIVAAGQRAGDVIRGIKGMLRKTDGARQLMDLNDVIAQTLRLTQADALAHDCAALTEFHPVLPVLVKTSEDFMDKAKQAGK